MSFRLLDHLGCLEIITTTNSQVTARCPICDAKLQINTRNSAYFCVAGCEASTIREKLGFPKYGNYKSKIEAPIVPISLPSKIELFKTVEKVVIPDSTYISAKHSQKVRRREYIYNETFKVVRIDLLVDKKKIFYPLELVENEWIVSIPDIPVLYSPIKFSSDDKFLIFVEGEKNVVDLCNIGLASVTVSSSNWGKDKLTSVLFDLHRKISGIIYIPDNDKVGIQKAIDVQTTCWRIGIPCKIVSLKPYYTQPKEDVSDLIAKGIDVVQIIEDL